MVPSQVTVSPKSAKAKNRLANSMDGDPICEVEQRDGDRWFLAASNRKYFFWVDVRRDDHWEVH